MKSEEIIVPLTVPDCARKDYVKNYMEITRESGKLMLFAGDQKVEHLNDDFFGDGIHEDDASPEHLFRIASQANIGVFASQLGLVARYGGDYKDVPYLIKMNSKTHLVGTDLMDPFSLAWYDLEQIVELKKKSGLNILGVGFTVYTGSTSESVMLKEAAQLIYKAHQNGLITVLWMYPRGKAVDDERDPHLIAGAAGVAACLGADFAKVNYPKVGEGAKAADGKPYGSQAEAFKEAIVAAGRTGVVCAGGSSTDNKKFLQNLHDQIHISGAMGNATGRNIHQHGLNDAVKMANAIYAVTVEGKSVDEAMGML